MKKIITAILALAMIIGCVAVFASCDTRPELDLDDAAENLEDEGYRVTYQDAKDGLSFGMDERLEAVSLNKDGEIDDYNDSDELTIVVFKDRKTANYFYKTQKKTLKLLIKSVKIQIDTYEFQLKNLSDEMDRDEEDSVKDSLKEAEKYLEKLQNMVIGKKGTIVWFGTKDAIKDSNG